MVGPNKAEKKEEEIDIVLTSATDILVCECKWQNEVISAGVLSTLKRRGALIQAGRNISYALFSKSGFSQELNEEKNVLRYSTEDILKLAEV